MKNKVIHILTIQLILLSTTLIAQVQEKDGLFVANSYPGGVVETKELKKSEIPEGSIFIKNNWNVGNILLSDDRSINNVPLKCNLRDDQLMILGQDESAKVVSFENAKMFSWFDSDKQKNITYKNTLEFNTEGSDLVGFFEILAEGKLNLYGYYTLKLIKGNYSITHDAGQINDEYLVEKKYFVDDHANLLPADKKKELKNILSDKSEETDTYIKKNGVKFNNEEDLIALIEYYNSL